MREGQGDRLQLLPVRAVARNRSFRFANSFIRFKAAFSETVARRGRSTLISFAVFFMASFCIHRRICQPSRRTVELTRRRYFNQAHMHGRLSPLVWMKKW